MKLPFSKEKKFNEYYRSIDDLPIYNWRKVQENNDLTYLIKIENEKLNEEIADVLLILWENIFAEYINTFGIGSEYKNVLRLQTEIVTLKNEILQKGKKSNITFIKIKQLELDELLKTKKVDNIDLTKVAVEKALGFRLNEKEITVKEYYNYIYALNKLAVKNGKSN